MTPMILTTLSHCPTVLFLLLLRLQHSNKSIFPVKSAIKSGKNSNFQRKVPIKVVCKVPKVGNQYLGCSFRSRSVCFIHLCQEHILGGNIDQQAWFTFDISSSMSIENFILEIFQQKKLQPYWSKWMWSQREAEEEAKYPSKFCHKVGQGVDQLFCPNLSFLRHCPKSENKVSRPVKEGRIPFADKCVLLVTARFGTPSHLQNLTRFH